MGPSMMSYSDFSTILIGDPTIKLSSTVNGQSQYNSTLGHKIADLDSTANSILDSKDYIFIAEQDGLVSVYNKQTGILQESHIKLPLNPKQMILLEDDPVKILILFEGNCHLEDTCTYILQEDDSQKLVLNRFDLPEQIKPNKIFTADLNNDSLLDLMIYDDDFNFSVFEQQDSLRLKKKFQSFIFPYSADYFLDPNFIFIESQDPQESINGFTSIVSSSLVNYSEIDLLATRNPDESLIDLEFTFNLFKDPTISNFQTKLGVSAPKNVVSAKIKINNEFLDMNQVSNDLFNYSSKDNIDLDSSTQIKLLFTVSKDSILDIPYVDVSQDEFITNTISQSLFEFVKEANFNTDSSLENLDFNQINQNIGSDGLLDIKIPFISGRKVLYLQSSEFGYFPVYQNLPRPTVNLTEQIGLEVENLQNASEDELNEYAERARINQFFTDANQDGISDFYTSSMATAYSYANETESLLNDVVCGDSCLANPYNDALLTPGSKLSPPVPIFGWGCPWGPAPIGFGTPTYPACGGRLYISPTLTGSFVLAPCIAQFCYKFQIATLPESVCNQVNSAIVGAMNFVAEGVSTASGGVVSLEDRGAAREFTPPSFPEIFSSWAKNQLFEIIKVIDLPDVNVIYPVLNADNEITDVDSFFKEFGFYTNDEDLSKIDSLNPYPSCPNNVNESNYESNKDKCGNFSSFDEFNSAKSSLFRRYSNNQQAFFEELSKMPIWNFEVENLPLNYPTMSEKELAKFLRNILLSIEKSTQNFLNAIYSWRCMEYENVPRSNEFGDFRQEKISDSLSKIFSTLKDPANQDLGTSNYEVVWNYKGKTYQEFTGEDGFMSAIIKEYAKFSDDQGPVLSFIIDLILGGQLSKIVSFVNQGQNGSQTDKQKACIDLTLGFEGLTTNFYQSYESALLWRDLPLQIFEIQDFVSKFTLQALDWGDQVLTNITGWYAENTKNLSTWTKMFESLIDIYNNFNLLLEIFVDFFDKCDDCKTRRGSSFVDIIIGLLPNFGDAIPYLEFPKIPDITLDISQIKAGLDIKVPIFKLNPEYLPLPKVDFELTFPSAPDVEIGLLFDGVTVPVLPEPPDISTLIEFPDLPKVQIPLLPVIPLAPEIGDIGINLQEEIGAELDLIKQLLRIYCLILQGLVPVPETSLAGAIQDITARPLDIVLPIDRQISIRFPELDLDYVREYAAILESDLVIETEIVYDALANLIGELNLIVDEKIGLYNQKVSELNDLLNIKYEVLKEYQLDEIEVNFNPSNQDQASLNLTNAFDLLSKATQIQARLNTSSLNTKVELADFTPRENFNLHESIFFDEEKFTEIKELTHTIYDNVNPLYVSSIDPSNFSLKSSLNKAFKVDTIDSSKIKDFAATIQNSDKINSILQDRSKLIAQNPAGVSSSDAEARYPTGVHYVDPNGSFRRLYSYDKQDQANANFIFSDLDLDRDLDIIHTIDSEVYFKPNSDINLFASGNDGVIEVESDLDKHFKSLKFRSLDVSTGFEEIKFYFKDSQNLDNQIIDIYKPGINKLEPFRRYVVLPVLDEQADQETDFEKTSSVQTNSGVINRGDFEEMFVKVSNSNSHKVQVPLGMYSLVYSSFIDEKLMTFENPMPVSVDFCSDRIAPTISGNIPQIANPVLFQDVDLDLSDSSDLGSKIISLSVVYNDQPYLLNLNNPIFDLPKIESEILETITIQAIDLAGNQSKLILNPKLQDLSIILQNVSNTNISGKIVPSVSQGNVTILKSNQNRLIPVKTTNVNESSFEFEFSANPNIEITDNKNRPVLELADNNLKVNDSSLEFTVLNAYQDLEILTLLVSKDNQPITKVLMKTDSNLSPDIVDSKSQALESSAQVVVFDEDIKDNLTVEIINDPLSDLDQLAMVKQNQDPILAISRYGNPILINKQYTLEVDSVRSNQELESLDEHWIALRSQENSENLISFKIQNLKDSVSLDQYKNQDFVSENQEIKDNPKVGVQNLDLNLNTQFEDVDSTTKGFNEINRLAELGIFEGVNVDGQNLFLPTNFLLRSEFAKTILKILCIKPRPESYLGPNVFSDILFSNNYDWFYPVTKETFYLGIFEGYKGEINQLGLSPFKPFNTISRIEAVKVIMEALENMDVISLDVIQEKNPWYQDYLKYAQDLTEILNPNQEVKSNFLLTQEEALEPNQPISRQDFAILISRALDIYNCIEQRSNLNLPLEDLRLNNDLPHIQESIERLSEIEPVQEDSKDQSLDELDVQTQNGLSENQLDILKQGIDSDDLPESSIGLMDPICTACPCPFEKKQGLSLQNKDKFFIIYGEYDPVNPIIYSTSKVFEINPNIDG